MADVHKLEVSLTVYVHSSINHPVSSAPRLCRPLLLALLLNYQPLKDFAKRFFFFFISIAPIKNPCATILCVVGLAQGLDPDPMCDRPST